MIKPDSPEAANMPALEVQKRLRAWQEKKMKLANPNFHVSRYGFWIYRVGLIPSTRLSVRGLPKTMTEKDLKDIFRKAAVSAEDTTKFGPAIKQVKIVMDPSLLDANGKPTSRGFGFVEFKRHFHALTALHNTNNKPSLLPGSRGRRLLVEFAVENSKMMQKRKHSLSKTSNKRQRPEDLEDNDDADQPVKRPRKERSSTGRNAKVTLPDKFQKKGKPNANAKTDSVPSGKAAATNASSGQAKTFKKTPTFKGNQTQKKDQKRGRGSLKRKARPESRFGDEGKVYNRFS